MHFANDPVGQAMSTRGDRPEWSIEKSAKPLDFRLLFLATFSRMGPMSRGVIPRNPLLAETSGVAAKRIFLIDDHTIVREGMKRMLSDEGEFVVCGEAASARGVLDELARTKPDLILLDISMPGADGIELIKDLKARSPNMRILVVSMHDENLYAERVLRAGASGYLMKDSSFEQLLAAVRTVLGGEIFLSQHLSSRLLHSLVRNKGTHVDELEKLSDRELEILRLIGNGYNSQEIAVALNISAKTVESHRGNMRQKLSLATGAELIRFAISHRQYP